MTTRKITSQQFEDGSVLDVQCLDQAITDTVTVANFMGPDIDASSMIQKQICWGMTPPRDDWATEDWNTAVLSPWLLARPTTADVDGNDIDLPGRLKSNDPYGVSLERGVSPLTAYGWAWQMSFWTDEPIIVTDLDIYMGLDQVHVIEEGFVYGPQPENWKWYDSPPFPLSVGDFVEDVVVSVVVDSPFNQQDPEEVSLTVHKSLFSLDSQVFSQTGAGDWQTDDMLPSTYNEWRDVPDGYKTWANGFWLQAKEVNAPIPAKSRVRVNIFVPQWHKEPREAGPLNVWTDGGSAVKPPTPFSKCRWSSTLTFLERKA